PQGKPRGISKVATDLRAVIIVEVAERLRRSLAARRSAATKSSNEALRQAQDRRKASRYLPRGNKSSTLKVATDLRAVTSVKGLT
ncbi:MAG: hypothetical protein ACJ07L_15900, partial [Opitutales bacterium]